MTAASKKEVIKRYNYIIGHIKGIQKMVEDDIYCMDVFNQNIAVIEAVKKINLRILDGHLNSCVSSAILSGRAKEKKRVLGELLEVFKYKGKS